MVFFKSFRDYSATNNRQVLSLEYHKVIFYSASCLLIITYQPIFLSLIILYLIDAKEAIFHFYMLLVSPAAAFAARSVSSADSSNLS